MMRENIFFNTKRVNFWEKNMEFFINLPVPFDTNISMIITPFIATQFKQTLFELKSKQGVPFSGQVTNTSPPPPL